MLTRHSIAMTHYDYSVGYGYDDSLMWLYNDGAGKTPRMEKLVYGITTLSYY